MFPTQTKTIVRKKTGISSISPASEEALREQHCSEKNRIKQFKILEKKAEVYPKVKFGRSTKGSPVLWYVLDQKQDRLLLLSKNPLMLASENELDKYLHEILSFFNQEEQAALRFSDGIKTPLFLLSYSQVEEDLSGHCEILCSGYTDTEARLNSSVGYRTADQCAAFLKTNFVPWYLSDLFEQSDPQTIEPFPFPLSSIRSRFLCINELGEKVSPIAYEYRDNLSGGGYYSLYYAIRPAVWIDGSILHNEQTIFLQE